FSRRGAGKEKVKGIADADLADFPVECVPWEDAQRFVERLSGRPEARAKRWAWRLPTEAEWEYSCRGGGISSTPFHAGVSLSCRQANFDGNYPYGGRTRAPTWGGRAWWVPTARTCSGCLTCTATSGSGARTGMRSTRVSPRPIPPAHPRA